MKKVVVASLNPVKINATREGFQKMFPEENFEFQGIEVASGVGHQPQNDHETMQGAINRADAALIAVSNADFSIGIEGGVDPHEDNLAVVAWIVVKSKEGKYGKARSGSFFLPPQVAALVREGHELGTANDIVFNDHNSKQKDGAIGLLTNKLIDRTQHYIEPIIMALIPFKNPQLY